MARRKSGDDDDVGPMEEREFKLHMKKIDLAQNEVEEAAEELKTQRSALSALWKDFKKHGGKPDVMRECMAMRKMDEGDLIQHEADRAKYADWMKLPLYSQASMFEEGPPRTEVPEEEHPSAKRGRRKAAETENLTGSPLN